jgi:HTH-type transcriptional regulator/antitoxin HigA
MAAIKTERQYEKAVERIEELLCVVGNNTPSDDKNFIELDLLSELVADYEAVHYPVRMPTLPEIIKSSMSERGLTQVALASMMGISVSRINEILSGKCLPTFKTAQKLHRQLQIDANLILA